MKISKELMLEIIEKFKYNVIHDKPIGEGVQYYDGASKKWLDLNVAVFNYRIKPEVLTLPEREIPKPLSHDEVDDSKEYFYVCNDKYFYESNSGRHIKDYDINFVYETKEEAIEASKLLFGLESM